MKQYIFLLSLLFILAACNTTKKSNDTDKSENELTIMQQKAIAERNKQLSEMGVGFIAYGSEPEWSMAINKTNKTLRFQLAGKEAQTFSLESMEYIDIMSLQTENPQTDLQITCIEKTCINNKSGEVFPLQVLLTSGGGSYIGCGKNLISADDSIQIVPSQLHDIWALEAVDGKQIDFSNETLKRPILEVNLQEMKIMGTTGCNNYQGSLFIENDLIHFGPIAMTHMYCEGSLELQFTKAMAKVARYQIKEVHLVLFDKVGNVILEFKKVD